MSQILVRGGHIGNAPQLMKYMMLIILFCLGNAISDAADEKSVYHVAHPKGKLTLTKKDLKELHHLSLLEIAQICFPNKANHDTAVFKVSDVVGAKKNAISKMVLRKKDWHKYKMRFNTHIYYYNSSSHE